MTRGAPAALLLGALVASPLAASAHHGGGGGAAGFDSPGAALGQPTTSVTLGSSALVLPHAAGDRVYLVNSLAGSVAFRHRVALEAAVPLSFGGEAAHEPGWSVGSSSLGVRVLALPGTRHEDPRVTVGASFSFPGTFSAQLQPAGSSALRTFGAISGQGPVVGAGGEIAVVAGFGEGASSLVEAAGFIGIFPKPIFEARVEVRAKGAFEGPLSERTLPMSLDLSGSVSLRPLPRWSVGVVVGGSLVTGFAGQVQAGLTMTIDLGDSGEVQAGDSCGCGLPEEGVPTM